MMERFRGHRADIKRLDPDKPVSSHVWQHKYVPFEVRILRSDIRDLNIRLRTEEAFIKIMDTKEPRGLNKR